MTHGPILVRRNDAGCFYHRRMLDSQEVLNSIDKRLVEARKEIASLESALTAMRKRSQKSAPAAATRATRPSRAATSKPATNGAAPTNGRTSRPRKAAAKRRSEVVPAGKLVTLLGTGSGMTTAELVTQTGGDRQQLLTLLRELEAAGEVRRSGERRATRWHVITDEDRIAARVAELERQSSRRTQAA
jgi:hypothetical protein